MAHIVIENLDSKAIDCKNKKERLLDILLTATDWMHACGGKGRCTTCRAIIVSGQVEPEGLTQAEQKYYDLKRLKGNERLMCQTYIGEEKLTIKVPQSSKFPHLTYTD
jgi:2Fe-2S ferredoxin